MIEWMRRHFWLSLFGLSGILIISVGQGWLPLDRVARTLIQPAGVGLSRIGSTLGAKIDELGNLGQLGEDKRRLETEVAELKAQLAGRREIEVENQQLRDQLNYKVPVGYRQVGADVINLSPEPVRRLLRINRGEGDGLSSGQPVLAAGNLIGLVGEVSSSSAEVIMVTDAEFRATAQAQDHRSTGIVKGTPPSGISFDRIPQGQAVSEGEAVVTSGLDGAFPAGLRLGEVVSLAQTAGSIFSSAQLKPAVNLDRLRVVTILVR